MTWIRWECETPDSDVVRFLSRELGLKAVHALGHYNAMCCGFGAHQPDGSLTTTSDDDLERWAQWDGRRGRYASAIRRWCAQAAAHGGSPDELRGWWRQRARLAKQERDRHKRNRLGNPPPPVEGSPQKPARVLGATENGERNENDTGSSSLRSELPSSLIRPAVAVAIAANAGLRANPLLRGFNELLPQQAEGPVTTWLEAGIPLPLVCETVEATARRYKPGVKGTQPSSFEYFDKPVRQAHARDQGAAQLQAAPTTKPASVPRIRRLV